MYRVAVLEMNMREGQGCGCRASGALAVPVNGSSAVYLLLFVHVLSEQLARPSKAASKEGNFLIPTEPPRGGPTPVTQSNVAAHLLTQFGLQVQCTSLLCG